MKKVTIFIMIIYDSLVCLTHFTTSSNACKQISQTFIKITALTDILKPHSQLISQKFQISIV